MAILPDYKSDYNSLLRELRQRLPMTPRPRMMGPFNGPTAGQFGMMSQTMPTAQDMQALTNRQEERATYGKYGQGGGIRALWDSLFPKPEKKKKQPSGKGITPPGMDKYPQYDPNQPY